jgi:rubredoxin
LSERPEQQNCDMCGQEPGTPYRDLPKLLLCELCGHMFEDYRRHRIREPGVLDRHHGPAPALTPFRLGVLSGLFLTTAGQRKLERLAEEVAR